MRKWYPMLLAGASVVVSSIAYPRLPERVPTHWDFQGNVNGWGNRAVVTITMPLLILAVWALLTWLPRLDPWRENYAKFQKTYDLVVELMLTLLFATHVIVVASTLGLASPLSLARFIPMTVGVFLVILGNVLPRVRRNFFLGIRTPWTLTNDRVWERTHRVGGYLLSIAGLLTICLAFFPVNVAGPAIGAALGTAALGSVVYSYFAWKQETSR